MSRRRQERRPSGFNMLEETHYQQIFVPTSSTGAGHTLAKVCGNSIREQPSEVTRQWKEINVFS